MRTPRHPAVRFGAPALILVAGFGGRLTIEPNGVRSLERPLTEFPTEVSGLRATDDVALSVGELRTLRPDEYLLREYADPEGRGMTLFVAWYGRQASGSSVHSPRNCLPGSGWEPVRHDRVETPTVYGTAHVNRYLVEHESGQRALVYYWYQGRGRVEANEYLVKADLVRDAVIRRRTDEGLVRLVFPVGRDEADLADADARAATVVRDVIRALAGHLPA